MCREKVIINDITKDNSKVLGDESKKTVKFHRLDRSMDESVSTFKSKVEVKQSNCGPKKKLPPAESGKLARRSNQ